MAVGVAMPAPEVVSLLSSSESEGAGGPGPAGPVSLLSPSPSPAPAPPPTTTGRGWAAPRPGAMAGEDPFGGGGGGGLPASPASPASPLPLRDRLAAAGRPAPAPDDPYDLTSPSPARPEPKKRRRRAAPEDGAERARRREAEAAERERAKAERRAAAQARKAAEARERERDKEARKRQAGHFAQAELVTVLDRGFHTTGHAALKAAHARILEECNAHGLATDSAPTGGADGACRVTWRTTAELGAHPYPFAVHVLAGEDFCDRVYRRGAVGAVADLLAGEPPRQTCLLLVGLDLAMTRAEQRGRRMADGTPFARARVQEALADILLQCGLVRYRAVVDASQAAEAVRLYAQQVAKAPYATGPAVVALDPKPVPQFFDLPPKKKAFAKALAKIPGLGPQAVLGVVARYRGFGELLAAYTAPGVPEKAKRELLKGLPRMGAVNSAKVYKFFVALDGRQDARDPDRPAPRRRS